MTPGEIADLPTEVLEKVLRRCTKEAYHWQSLSEGSHHTARSEHICIYSLKCYNRLAAAIHEELARRDATTSSTV